ncbi:hypothetical protein AB1A81_17310 [Bdellovibrio bacteriovorus]|nr:hypothetical protein [Bdellovibrio bacteriovorus]
MKVRFKKATWRAVGGIFASFVLIVSFQNCGKAGFDSDLDSTLDAGLTDAELSAKYGSTTGAKVSAIPFAFDAGFDTITYNSCADTHLRNNPAFFSIKAGAYSTGGIKLTNEFFDYADTNFNPVYPATELTENQYKEYLADSPANNGAVATMAIRVKNSLTDVYTATNKLTLWTDVIPLVAPLTDSLVMDSFAQKNTTANYFPFSPESRVMEAQMNFNSSESLANEYRSTFMTAAILSLTFMPNNGELYEVRSPAATTPVKTAYGKGYSLVFTPAPVSGAAVNNPNNILSSISEYDLQSANGSVKSWNCGRRYAVIRTQDASSLCPAQSYSDISGNATYRSELAVMRRHLRADQWDVNVALKCVVPKGGVSCYKEESINGAPVTEYDLTKECFRENGSYSTTVPNSRCMHWVTVCTRD